MCLVALGVLLAVLFVLALYQTFSNCSQLYLLVYKISKTNNENPNKRPLQVTSALANVFIFSKVLIAYFVSSAAEKVIFQFTIK